MSKLKRHIMPFAISCGGPGYNATFGLWTFRWRKVTCKRCLALRKKRRK